jgi:hypothetical protein
VTPEEAYLKSVDKAGLAASLKAKGVKLALAT